MKKSIIIALFSFVLIGCTENKKDIEKDKYLTLKEELLEQTEYSELEDLNFDLTISIDRINEEEISYRAIIDNPKEIMNNVKALVIHDHFTVDIFPTIGIFDEPINLIINNEEVKGISLVGYIQTNKDIEELDLNIKTYIEYTTDEGNLVKIYYKTTN